MRRNIENWLLCFVSTQQFETKQTLSKFEGSTGISSSDFFGNGAERGRSGDYGSGGPDLAEIKEGVKQGVTKVAGKLSSLANGMMNSLQVYIWHDYCSLWHLPSHLQPVALPSVTSLTLSRVYIDHHVEHA